MIFQSFDSALTKVRNTLFNVANTSSQSTHISEYDPLTGAMNRRAFDDRLRDAINSAQDNDSDIALLYIDIDNLKRFNNHNGHVAGDELLKRFVMLVKPLLANQRSLFRFGGEEFIILLPNFDREKAWCLSQQICDVCRVSLSPFQPNHCGCSHCLGPADMSVSIGISLFEQDMTPESLVDKSERNMWNAKDAGKDRAWM